MPYPYVKAAPAESKATAIKLLKAITSIENNLISGAQVVASSEKIDLYSAAALLTDDPNKAKLFWEDVNTAFFANCSKVTDAWTTTQKTLARLQHVLGDQGGWNMPDDLEDTAEENAVFPQNVFDSTIERYISSVSDTIQVPRAAAASALLATVALSVQGKFEVSYIDDTGHSEPLCLYVAVTQHPGERKTAVLSEITRPVNQWIAETSPDYNKECAKVKANMKALSAREQGLEKSIKQTASKSADDADKTKERLEQLRKDLEEVAKEKATIKQPPSPHKMLDDVTPEAICHTMETTDETAGIFTAEADFLRILGGLYSKGNAPANLSLALKAYDRERYRHTRSSGNLDITLYRPLLTMCVFIQPELSKEFFGNAQLQGRGLPARFVSCSLPRNAGNLRADNSGHKIDRSAYNEYMTTVKYFLDIPRPSRADPTPVLEWEDEAKATIIPYLQHIQDMMKEGGELYGGLEDYGSKAAAHCIRIAGLLHLMKHPCTKKEYMESEIPAPPLLNQIDKETAEQAMKINEYYMRQRIRQCEAAAAEPVDDAALLFAKILEKTVYKGQAFTNKGNLKNGLRKNGKLQGEKFDKLLDDLQSMNIIEIATEPGTKRECIYLSPFAAFKELSAMMEKDAGKP